MVPEQFFLLYPCRTDLVLQNAELNGEGGIKHLKGILVAEEEKNRRQEYQTHEIILYAIIIIAYIFSSFLAVWNKR